MLNVSGISSSTCSSSGMPTFKVQVWTCSAPSCTHSCYLLPLHHLLCETQAKHQEVSSSANTEHQKYTLKVNNDAKTAGFHSNLGRLRRFVPARLGNEWRSNVHILLRILLHVGWLPDIHNCKASENRFSIIGSSDTYEATQSMMVEKA